MKQLIAGNWKMNLVTAQVVDLIEHLIAEEGGPEIVVCPPFPYLSLAKHMLAGKNIRLGAQDCAHKLSGAFTGDVGANMLVDVGCEYVIIGHSERRHGHGETSTTVNEKASLAISQGLIAIICIGETDGENQAGITEEVLLTQMQESIPTELTADQFVLAYEPVWAIGTGRTATADEIIHAHNFIRSKLRDVCGDSEAVRILYGGSVNGTNAPDILTLENVNGVLVGGASLKPDEFNQIIKASR